MAISCTLTPKRLARREKESPWMTTYSVPVGLVEVGGKGGRLGLPGSEMAGLGRVMEVSGMLMVGGGLKGPGCTVSGNLVAPNSGGVPESGGGVVRDGGGVVGGGGVGMPASEEPPPEASVGGAGFGDVGGSLATLEEQGAEEDDMDGQDGEYRDTDMGFAWLVQEASLGDQRVWSIHGHDNGV